METSTIREIDETTMLRDIAVGYPREIAQMELEHENAGTALARMRQITSNYSLPADACPTFAALYSGMSEMEADLHRHIHLENNILFPKARELEKA